MSGFYHTKNGRTSKRGAFINGIWHCDCDPRLPAEKFQTKNGGKNHGRWFYTCQKPQPKRCSFFLWSDDAKVREEAAVISNSRTEPDIATDPETPKKTHFTAQPATPFSEARSEAWSDDSPTKKPWSPLRRPLDDESFDWSSSGDEELVSVADAVTEDEGSPKKTPRTPLFSSPGKRSLANTTKSNRHEETWPYSDDVFLTPTTSTKSSGLPSPLDSHSKMLQSDVNPSSSISLTSEVLQTLKAVNIPSQIEHDLVEVLKRHELRTQGIMRGRDITRVAVQTKEKKIAELQARITALEAEKETTRAVIAHLKQDIATSPKRPSRSRFGSRSEI